MSSAVPVDQILKYLNTTNGREKLYRTIQYFSRFYAWYLLRQGASKETIARWNGLKTNLASGRKLFRLFKPIEFGKAAVATLNINDSVLRITGALRQLGYFGYYFVEMFVYLHQVGFITLQNHKKITDLGFKFWAAGLVFSITNGLYKLKQTQAKIELVKRNSKLVKASSSEKDAQRAADYRMQEKTLIKDKEDATYQLVQDALDLVIPSSTLGWINADEGVVGIVGTITSVMGAQTQWKKISTK
ncbi:peroxisomal biogenesis factor 11 [Umbelopsis sp. PMI_123]|nr:peroxisomal biogenesis factor 11 [Umbelopsis sp. PMI_123]